MTKEYGLGRLEQFDERSRSFPVAAVLQADQPRSYSWHVPITLNQGREGACVGFSMAHDLASTPVAIKGVTNDTGKDIYKSAQRIDEWPGEDYSGTSVLAGIKTLQSRGYVKEYRWAFDIQDLAVAVSRLGPAILGIPWYSGMYSAPGGKLKISGEVVGGHAILCHGYSVKRREFKLHNSWGLGWGVEGNAWIPWDDLDRLLHERGEAVIPIGRKKLTV